MPLFQAPLRILLLAFVAMLAACSPTQDSSPLDDASGGLLTPDTTGLEQAAAEQAIRDAGLRVGTVTVQSSDDQPIGSVIRTDPRAGFSITTGSTVNIVVSSGTANVMVPDTSGNDQTQAETSIGDSGLTVGNIVAEASDMVPVGQVIRSVPEAGTMAQRGSSVVLVISTGPANVSVPDVTNLTEAAASTDLTDATLLVGTVTGEASDIVPFGNIIGQTPVSGAMVSANTAVNLVVSLGPANIAVPDISSLTETAAIAALEAAGLVAGDITTQASVDVAAEAVISQDPAPGTLVAMTTAVNLLVSVGPNPLPVPDIVGLTETEATTVIANSGLNIGLVTRRFDNVIPQGEVISQGRDPGSLVIPDTTLDFLVSLGPPVATPNLVGLAQADAEAALLAVDLLVGTITEANDFNIPLGSVISQDPNGGINVPEGTVVDFVVSLGPPTVAVPNVVGLTQAAASAALTAGELNVGAVTQQNSASVPIGQVISQTPVAAIIAIVGSNVDLVISLGPVIVTVPNVAGQPQAQAEAALVGANLAVGAVTEQNDNSVPLGSVISQNPAAGAMIPEGSVVALVVSLGPAPVVTPNVVGQSRAAADSSITGVGLLVGTVTEQSSDSVPAGSVISQNPAAGESVSSGSNVDLVVSSGPAVDNFSDEFSVDSLGDWSVRHQVEVTAAQYSTLDINQSTLGALTIVPNQTPGWFDDGDAPLVFKLLSGDFAVHARVLADSVTSPGQAPVSDFNSAGLMARDADGASNPENHIMLNIGRQDARVVGGIGSETKTTVDSSSTLIIDAGSNSGDLVLCRIGDEFRAFRLLSGDADWIESANISRPDLPVTLQVGMVANAFTAPADLRATFEFIRLLPTPATAGDCTP